MRSKVTSLRKLASARANGALSRGPVTFEGKARSAQNALKHGLTARAIALSSEDASVYDRLRAAYYAQFRPRTPHECDLVDTLVGALWRSRRAIGMESACYDLETESQRSTVDREYDNCSPDVRAALAFQGDLRDERSIVALSHLSLRFDRLYYRTLKLLDDLLSRPPIGPSQVGVEPVCDAEPDTGSVPDAGAQKWKNEPNPTSGHNIRIIRFTRVAAPLVMSAASDSPPAAASQSERLNHAADS